MSTKNKRVSILTYWTNRYVLTLCIGLLIISLISALWIRHTTVEYRLEMMTFIAEQTANRLTDTSTVEIPDIKEKIRLNFREIDPDLYITNSSGEVISTNRPFELYHIDFLDLIQGEELDKITIAELDEIFYVIKKEIKLENELIGYVFILESKEKLTQVNQEYGQLAIFIVSLGIFGWLAIYFLSRRLSKPIMNVAEAAKKVKDGNYDIQLTASIKEKEVYELVSSFKEMAAKLQQLEKTRTELLAGVTHELKTPVTSISGLLQAVQDGVVAGDEADDFIKMALVETTKMKTMVGDLLAFNSFAVDAVPVKIEQYEINILLEDIIAQWKVTHKSDDTEVRFLPSNEEILVSIDLVRMQQIVTNLLTNAEQSMTNGGEITISIQEQECFVEVHIRDNGKGISMDEQPFIFERFFRGENKKYEVRGLGLGLPLSKMMAQSIGGDLLLTNSSEEGTAFKITVNKSEYIG